MKPIAIYARVSTAKQEEEQTIKTQITTLKEFAVRNGYTIVREYTDEGWSGDILARPALDRMRQDVKEKIWEAVLIYDPDRLARRYSYQELIMDELREKGVEVIFITVSAPKNSEDKILHGVRGLFAEYERTKIAERFRLGKLRKVKEGNLLVSEPLYGYNYVSKQDNVHGYYIINEIEARVVRLLFSWVADERMTLRKIVKRLQEMGIKPRKSKRGVWSTSTLSTLLRHKGYIGEAHWGRTYGTVPEKPYNKGTYRKLKKSSRKLKPEEEWVTIPIPAIVDKSLFERTRKVLDINYALCQRNKKNEYLLAGKIWCTCGKRRCGEGPQKGKHLYYRCSSRVNNFPLPANCKERGINARIADKLVWGKIAELMTDPELMQEQINGWQDRRKVKRESATTNTDAIKREIDQLKVHEERYNKAYGAGLFTLEQLSAYIAPIKDRIHSLQTQVARNKTQREINDILFPDEVAIISFAQESTKLLHSINFATRRAIITNVIEKIIGNKEILYISGYIPVNQDVKQCSIHRNGQDTNRHLDITEVTTRIPFEFRIDNLLQSDVDK